MANLLANGDNLAIAKLLPFYGQFTRHTATKVSPLQRQPNKDYVPAERLNLGPSRMRFKR